MDSEFHHRQYHHHFQNPQRQFPYQNQHINSLTRFNSAPSSYLASFLDDNKCENRDVFSNARPLSPETESIFAKFMSSMSGENNDSSSSAMEKNQSKVEVKLETQTQENRFINYTNPSQKMVYKTQSKPPLARQSNAASRAAASVSTQTMKIEGGNSNNDSSSSGLTRHCSSPAGFFSNMFNIDHELMNQNSNNFEAKILNASENQSGNGMNHHPQLLSHHLSLPKPSVEISAREKLWQLQDIVPCRTRAKRGFATHPRSIAERVRRTKISERMRKLQALVPNMNEQTNTADMLDLAVDYIKDLQNQVKALSDRRDKCTCCCS